MSGISYWQKVKSLSDYKARISFQLVMINAEPKSWSKEAILEDFKFHPAMKMLAGSFVAMKTFGFDTKEIHFDVE
uniref:Uncharacterized protein n=1 Tax=viral metagenome TaxID=1070528 RepID=A0A6C0CHA6_9ZZZZ